MSHTFLHQNSGVVGGLTISGTVSVTGDLLTLLNDDDNAAAAATTRFMVALDVSAIKGISIRSSVDATLKTNGKQVETATVLGGVTGSGNASVIVTAVGLAGTPLTTAVAVLNGDTASDVGQKIRTALALVAAITDDFTISGSGANVVLTKIVNEATDATFNISIDDDTSAGLTAAPTSVGSASAGDETLTLTAGIPYIWTTSSPDALLLTTDVVSMAVVVAGATAGTFQVGAVSDSTP